MNNHTIKIEGIECYAYHGCLEEEAKIGGHFSVDVTLHLDLTKAIATDELSETADYVAIHNLVREQMNIRSKLIEHVAGRILQQLKSKFMNARQQCNDHLDRRRGWTDRCRCREQTSSVCLAPAHRRPATGARRV